MMGQDEGKRRKQENGEIKNVKNEDMGRTIKDEKKRKRQLKKNSLQHFLHFQLKSPTPEGIENKTMMMGIKKMKKKDTE